jgi:hypothetical protein
MLQVQDGVCSTSISNSNYAYKIAILFFKGMKTLSYANSVPTLCTLTRHDLSNSI